MESEPSSSKNEKRINRIFKNLQDKGFVKKNRYLKSGDRFKAGIFNWNKIQYPGNNPRKDLSKLSNDAIRWSLLHEEAHLSRYRGHQYFYYGVILYLLALFTTVTSDLTPVPNNIQLIIQYFINLHPWLIIVDIMISIIVGLVFLHCIMSILSHSYLSDVEHSCDRWAAQKMKNHYGVNNPSRIAKESKEWVESWENQKENRTLFKKLLILILKPLSPHVPWCVRIEKIKDLDED